MSLEIVFENEDLIAINKPHGLLVHRTKMANDVQEFALQQLRDQINQYVFPTHRLDRKTSGVLLFAKSKEVNIQIQQLFQTRKIKKSYVSIVRGFIPIQGAIEYPLKHEGKIQQAITNYQCLEQFELAIPYGKFETVRYSFVRLFPQTGRFHQLRKHLAHIFHPIIGDRPHGCNKQNRFWKNQFNMTNMLLHAEQLDFEFPVGTPIKIEAQPSLVFRKSLKMLREQNIL